jgi:hypothetical protein
VRAAAAITLVGSRAHRASGRGVTSAGVTSAQGRDDERARSLCASPTFSSGAGDFTSLYSATDATSADLALALAERLWLAPRFDASLDAGGARTSVTRALRGLLPGLDALAGLRWLTTRLKGWDAERQASRGARALLRIARAHRCDHLVVVLPERVLHEALGDLRRCSPTALVQLHRQAAWLWRLELDVRSSAAHGLALHSTPGVAL